MTGIQAFFQVNARCQFSVPEIQTVEVKLSGPELSMKLLCNSPSQVTNRPGDVFEKREIENIGLSMIGGGA